jgi:hypothetical protein
VIHSHDAVPHKPSEYYGYYHTAHEVFFDKEMQDYKICSENGEDKQCSDQYHPDFTWDDHDLYFISMTRDKNNCKVIQEKSLNLKV